MTAMSSAAWGKWIYRMPTAVAVALRTECSGIVNTRLDTIDRGLAMQDHTPATDLTFRGLVVGTRNSAYTEENIEEAFSLLGCTRATLAAYKASGVKDIMKYHSSDDARSYTSPGLSATLGAIPCRCLLGMHLSLSN